MYAIGWNSRISMLMNMNDIWSVGTSQNTSVGSGQGTFDTPACTSIPVGSSLLRYNLQFHDCTRQLSLVTNTSLDQSCQQPYDARAWFPFLFCLKVQSHTNSVNEIGELLQNSLLTLWRNVVPNLKCSNWVWQGCHGCPAWQDNLLRAMFDSDALCP